MTDEELTQFKTLAKKYERGKDKDAVLKIISEDIHEVYQDVNDKGHSAATAAKQKDIDGLSTQLTAEKGRADDLDRQLKARQEAPDIATMRQKYEDDERKLRQQHDEALIKQKQGFETQLQEKDKTIVNTRLSVAKEKLVKELTAEKLAIDPDYASTVIIARPDVVDRIKVEEDGSVKVLKKGSTDMFIVPAEGRSALDHLAEEVAEGVDDKWKTSGVSRGSGTSGSQGGSNGSTTQRFDAARARVKELEGNAAKAKESGSGLERLGARR